MKLYFIRHAQSENNALFDRTGQTRGRSHDPQVTEIGRQQIERLAGFIGGFNGFEAAENDAKDLGGFGLTHIYCSPMIRATMTAYALAQTTGILPVMWVDLHESGGIYLDDEENGGRVSLPGCPRSQFEQQFPGVVLPPEVTEQGWYFRPYEPAEERLPRARRVVEMLLARHGGSNDRVALVSHGAFFNSFITALLNFPADHACWFEMNNVAISRFDLHADYTRIAYLNRTDFLPPELIT